MPIIGRMGRPGLLGMAARTAIVAGTATAVSGAVAGRQQARAAEHQRSALQQQQMEAAAAPAAPASPQPAAPDLVAQLQQLGALAQQGILSPEEFQQAKRQLLGG